MFKCRLSATVLFLIAAASSGKSAEPSPSWLMRNYRFAPPPAPRETEPAGPVVAQMQDIQNTTLSILRKANFAGDFEAALAAAAQAMANAQLIGMVTGQLKPLHQTQATAADQPKHEPPVYMLAFQDHRIQGVTAIWRDRLMLHYLTVQGAHEQVRFDSVDWKLSAELNARSGLRSQK